MGYFANIYMQSNPALFLVYHCNSWRDWYGKKFSEPDLKSIYVKMSQNRKGEVSLELPSMFFPCGEKLSAPKKGQLSHCTVVQNLSLCWTTCSQAKTIRSWALPAVPGHSGKHACGIAAEGEEGSSSIWGDSHTELWPSGGTSLGLNSTCEVYHQSPEKNGSIQSVFIMPLLSVCLAEVIYSMVSRSAPALIDTQSSFPANSLLKEAFLTHLQMITITFLCVVYLFFIFLHVLWFLQLCLYVLFMVEKWCAYIWVFYCGMFPTPPAKTLFSSSLKKNISSCLKSRKENSSY